MPHSCLTSWALKKKKKKYGREVWERRYYTLVRECVRLMVRKSTWLSVPTGGRWTVLALSTECPIASTDRQSSQLFLGSNLNLHVRGGSPISQRVSIHLQARVTGQVILRPCLFSGPESLTENSLWLCFVTVAAPHMRDPVQVQEQDRNLRNCFKGRDKRKTNIKIIALSWPRIFEVCGASELSNVLFHGLIHSAFLWV